ncbi:hypothetical protein DL770_000740 [Monosporascus sp. CRB-9-2]|nr:hypothetical protein DL770_000740 [Monosporascus sp. CRB-9-2]
MAVLCDEPNIRYSWEAINDASGAAAHPLNHDPTLEYMEKVRASVYAKELEQGDPPATTLMHAVEYYKNASFGLKTYFSSRKWFQGGNPATWRGWDGAVVKLNPGGSHPACDAVMNFLANSTEGELMKPSVLGMDNVEPSKSRLKTCFASRHTGFESVRGTMTMGGLRDVSEFSLQDLRPLILAILGLPGDYPGDA